MHKSVSCKTSVFCFIPGEPATLGQNEMEGESSCYDQELKILNVLKQNAVLRTLLDRGNNTADASCTEVTCRRQLCSLPLLLVSQRHQPRQMKSSKTTWPRHLHTHLLPATAPSFLPKASSSSTPAQVPLAKSVSPTYFRIPGLDPLTNTLSPIFSPALAAAACIWALEAGEEALLREDEEPDGARLPPRPWRGVVGRAVGEVRELLMTEGTPLVALF